MKNVNRPARGAVLLYGLLFTLCMLVAYPLSVGPVIFMIEIVRAPASARAAFGLFYSPLDKIDPQLPPALRQALDEYVSWRYALAR